MIKPPIPAGFEKEAAAYLERAHRDFASAFEQEYAPSMKHRLVIVRQFCDFVLNGRNPQRHMDPGPPRIRTTPATGLRRDR